jgi:hypothetical protein
MSSSLPAIKQPTIDVVHKDIALGNQYRLELDKLLLTLATALLAFSVAFVPTLRQVDYVQLMMVGWACLAASVVGGVVELHGWERFYLTYRDYEHKGEDGTKVREQITGWRRFGRFVQMAGFAAGVVSIAAFYISNFQHLKLAQ